MEAKQIEENLTRQIESASRKVARALLQAIEDGAEVKCEAGVVHICKQYVMTIPSIKKAAVVLYIENKELYGIITDDTEALKNEREALQKRIAEIDEELKPKGAES